jgi:hypothetical protein
MRKKADKGKTRDHGTNNNKSSLGFADSEPLPFTPPRIHHHISESKRYYENLPQWISRNAGDPAVKVRIPPSHAKYHLILV